MNIFIRIIFCCKVLISLIASFSFPLLSSATEQEAGVPTSLQEQASTRSERWDNVLKGKLPINGGSPDEATSTAARQLPPPKPPTESAKPDPATMVAYHAAVREYYTYLEKGLQHRQRVFVWQHYSSIMIFVIVVLLVAVGIYFAAVQFHHGLRQGKPSGELATQLEASASGIKVSSPVLGVIILVISLLFFYLYLAFVYPISELV